MSQGIRFDLLLKGHPPVEAFASMVFNVPPLVGDVIVLTNTPERMTDTWMKVVERVWIWDEDGPRSRCTLVLDEYR